MIYLGIDPGIEGAYVVLDDDSVVLRASNLPTAQIGGKNRIDTVAWMGILETIMSGWSDDCIICGLEQPFGIPGSSINSMTFGETQGRIAGVVELFVPRPNMSYINPKTWKTYFKLSSNKRESIYLANNLCMGLNLTKVKEADIAEAALIAKYVQIKDFED